MTYLSTTNIDSLSSNGKPSWANKDLYIPYHKKKSKNQHSMQNITSP
jgi:hypothetical protein